jgi:FkbM family methyltransferase
MEIHGWFLPDGDLYFRQLLENSVSRGMPAEYQLPHRLAALRSCSKFRLAVDVGAHLGFWSRHLSTVFENVHAFEPSKVYRDLLALNAPKVTIHPTALGDKEGEGSLLVPKVNSGAAFLTKTIKGNESVSIRPLDSFSLDCVDFIKIDCEGFEYQVIQGALGTLERCSPVICIEQKKGVPGRFDEHEDQYKTLKFLIENLNYRVANRVVDDWILTRESK